MLVDLGGEIGVVDLDDPPESFEAQSQVPVDRVPVNQGAPQEGPLGIVPEGFRSPVRQGVESLDTVPQFLTEIAPSAIGAAKGAALGAPFGLPGVVIGGGAGGLAGELIAQETGVAPESDLNLAFAAGGPLAGVAAGKALQTGAKLTGFSITKFPFARTAAAVNALKKGLGEFQSIGEKILAKQKGFLKVPKAKLFAAVRRSGLRLKISDVRSTRLSLNQLINEMSGLESLDEVSQAIGVLTKAKKTLDPGNFPAFVGKAGTLRGEVSLDTLVKIRREVGLAITRAETKGGVKLGASKKVFASIVDDMDRIAAAPGVKGNIGRLAKGAVAKAKLEFSIGDLEQAVARFTDDIKTSSGGVTINIKGLKKWLRLATDPKAKAFNKNLTASLADELPGINKRLDSLIGAANLASPGGPGSLVVRGATAKIGSTLIGGLIGFGEGGLVGGGLGAVVGANIPETIVSILTTETGSKFLERAARLGKGSISLVNWAIAGEIATRASGDRGGRKKTGPTIDIPRPDNLRIRSGLGL